VKKTQLVETLVKTGLVTEAVMAQFLKRAQAEGQNPIKLLLEEGKIDDHTFVQSAGLQLGFRLSTLSIFAFRPTSPS
jgi:hypothetical protein